MNYGDSSMSKLLSRRLMPQNSEGICSKLARYFAAPLRFARRTLEERTSFFDFAQ
jgi:hypothetical protein